MNNFKAWKSALVIAVTAAIFSSASNTSADLIVQNHTTHLAFEAESYDSLIDVNGDSDNWMNITDASASGGTAIQATGPASGTSFSHSNDGVAVYKLEFTKATDFYSVYARYRNLGSGSTDSFLTSNDTPSDTDPLRRWFGPTADSTNAVRSLGNETNGVAGTYYYSFLGLTAAVTAGTYDFRVGIREKDVELDRFLFVDSSNASTSGPLAGVTSSRTIGVSAGAGHASVTAGLTILDALANSSITVAAVPEPTAFAFGSLVAMLSCVTGMIRRRK